MKKLALALVCLVSVAFFASCDPEITNPEPTIAVMTGDNFVYDGQTIEMNTNYSLGFVAASNAQTLKELKTFNLAIKIVDTENEEIYADDTTYNVSGTEYVYQNDEFGFAYRDLIGKVEITATITDVDNQVKSTTINLNLNAEEPIFSTTFEWVRRGTTLVSEAEMAAVGLNWPGNYPREDFVRIVPLDGCVMYIVEDGDDFDAITTQSEKDAYFADLRENGTPAARYTEISAWAAERTYNTMLAVIDAAGEKHLVHISRSTVGSAGSAGGLFTIFGELK